jgi:uncharacterized protein (TIGR00299 family) protein
MRVAYLDCFSGVAGDMFLGALLDAGLPLAALRAELEKLGLSEFRLEAQRTWREALQGTKVDVVIEPSGGAPRRGLAEIKAILAGSALDPQTKERAAAVFRRLAEAEAHVHGTTPEEVHFHEVGAVDAIVDVVGTVAGLRLLDVEELHVSRLTLGRGLARSEHGTIPVPVPATMQLLEGLPVLFSDLDGELVTPTGAALVATLATRVGSGFSLVPRAVGYGFGTRERKEGPPNAVRLILGDIPDAFEELVLLETNLDDATGQIVGYLLERVLEAGALDAWAAPVQMKKSRPGILFSALADESRADAVESLMYAETPTLGVRRQPVRRSRLERKSAAVETSLGTVRVKFVRGRDGTPRAAAEYEDVARIAREKGLAYQQALHAIQRELPPWPA